MCTALGFPNLWTFKATKGASLPGVCDAAWTGNTWQMPVCVDLRNALRFTPSQQHHAIRTQTPSKAQLKWRMMSSAGIFVVSNDNSAPRRFWNNSFGSAGAILTVF